MCARDCESSGLRAAVQRVAMEIDVHLSCVLAELDAVADITRAAGRGCGDRDGLVVAVREHRRAWILAVERRGERNAVVVAGVLGRLGNRDQAVLDAELDDACLVSQTDACRGIPGT